MNKTRYKTDYIVHDNGEVFNLSPQAYLDKAVSIYQGSVGTAWATW